MASHVINNIADSYAYEHDAMEWKNEIKSIAEKYDNQIIMQKEKLYDFKQTRQMKVYNRSSKPKKIPLFKTSKKMLFFKSS